MTSRSVQRRMRDIAIHARPVAPDMRGENIIELFNENPEITEIPVVNDAGIPVGIIVKSSFLLRVGHRFGYEVYAKRPVSLLMDQNPILVDGNEYVSDFVNTLLNTPGHAQLSCFIVTDNEQYCGVGSNFSLTQALHQQAVRTIQELSTTTAELRTANRAILQDKLFISSIIENIPTAIEVQDLEARSIVLQNRAAKEIHSYVRPASEQVSGVERMVEASGVLVDAAADRCEETLLDKGGDAHILSRRCVFIKDTEEQDRWELCVTDDITEYREAQHSIERLAHYDSLTKLPNRNCFNMKLNSLASSTEHSFVLLYIDLDYFKSINDMYGHGAGDALLRNAAQRLQDACRKDDFVARLGGDEFAVIWPHVDPLHDLEGRLAELVKCLSKPYPIEGTEALSGASIGAALFPQNAQDSTTLLQYADMALYRAKALGRNQYRLFDRELSHEIRERAALVAGLHSLVRGEGLSLHYQPIFCLKQNRIKSYEALARWNYPGKGPIPPDVFIKLAEESGLIHQLEEKILWMACQAASNWPEDVSVAVNVSPLQLKDRKFSDTIKKILDEVGLDASRLDIEITESILIDENGYKISVLNEIRRLGCRINIDDFGTGYSSLSYLWKIPFDKIKIDRSFVQALPDPTAREIIQAIVGIASIRTTTVVVEGVETSQQLDMVRNMGCAEAQGYFLGKPSPIMLVAQGQACS